MDIPRPVSKQPMPADAKKVFTGKMFDMYQWEQKLFDGTTATFERIRRADTVVTFPVLPDGRILLLKQQQPNTGEYISGAGGRMDPGEEPLQAAKRELLEETGYHADEWVLLDAQQPVGKIEWVVYTFIAKRLRKVAEPSFDGGEKIRLYPISFKEFLMLSSNDTFSEEEIRSRLFEARLDPLKMEHLQNMFLP